MDIMDFNFVRKTKGRRAPSNNDITIVTSENSGGTTYFTFRNEVYDDISPNTGCFVYAVVGSRIYFKEASSADGYTFTTNNKKNDKRYCSFSGKLHTPLYEFMKDKNGDYDMVFDGRNELWFIDTSITFTGKNGRLV